MFTVDIKQQRTTTTIQFLLHQLIACIFVSLYLEHSYLKIAPYIKEYTVKILKIGTPKIIALIGLQMEQLDFTVQYCVHKMLTE